MAKKASKKEATAAKKAKVAKKAPAVKAAKTAKPVAKAAAKPAKASAAKVKPVARVKAAESKASAAKKAKSKVEKAPAEKAKKTEVSKAKVSVEKPPKASKPLKIEEKVSSKLQLVKSEPELEAEAPKKEKKAKIDRTGLNEEQLKWHELHEKLKGVKAPAYTISGQYEAKTPIAHKIFGWGFILSNEYDRLEVLFQDAKRMLISNRKL